MMSCPVVHREWGLRGSTSGAASRGPVCSHFLILSALECVPKTNVLRTSKSLNYIPGWGQLKHQCTSLGCEYMRDDGATENLRAQLMKLWCPWSFLTFMRSGLAIVGFHQRRSLNIVRAVEKCDLASFHKDYSWFMVSIKLIVLDVLELHQV